MGANFAQATAIEQIDANTYSANFDSAWTIGTVPHGGYVTACFQCVVKKHFSTTLKGQNQPHTITLHLDFLRRTQAGPALFEVRNVKLGRQTSVVHVTLTQENREEVVGYLTNSNINTETGASFSTDWSLFPKPLPVSDFAVLDADQDPDWGERKQWPFSDFRKVTRQIRSWFPRRGQHSQACLDMWYSFTDPESRFTNESLGFVCDTFPQILESHLMDGLDAYGIEFERTHSQEEQKKLMKGRATMWYPTLLLNMDVKKALPEEGVRWLFVRLQAKVIKNGRYDLEVLVLDAEGDLVAVSNHVVFAVSAERNTSARRKQETEPAKL